MRTSDYVTYYSTTGGTEVQQEEKVHVSSAYGYISLDHFHDSIVLETALRRHASVEWNHE